MKKNVPFTPIKPRKRNWSTFCVLYNRLSLERVRIVINRSVAQYLVKRNLARQADIDISHVNSS